MHINSEQMKAFLEIHRHHGITKASKALGITQSALSQKIAKLEESLQVTLIIRSQDGLKPTAAGEKLLSFARQQLQLEEQFLSQFTQNESKDKLCGVFRIASFSSITRSLLLPTLAPLLRQHHELSIEFKSYEVVELKDVLKSNQADCIVSDEFPNIPLFEQVEIGKEEYVEIVSKMFPSPEYVYLDHGSHDHATLSFFKHQKLEFNHTRRYMGDVYGILDGVRLGLGRAIMSRHLIQDDPQFIIVPHQKKYERPLVLCYIKQSYYSPIQKRVIEILNRGIVAQGSDIMCEK